MADPLSIISGVVGVAAATISTARVLLGLIGEIRDAPTEILHIQNDVQSLTPVLTSTQTLCTKYALGEQDRELVEGLAEYISLCQRIMSDITGMLKGFAPPPDTPGGSRSWSLTSPRNPMRVFEWVIRKGEIKQLRDRLQEGKASLNLAISALNGVLDGKGQDEIKRDLQNLFEQLTSEFRSASHGVRIRRKVEDDVASVTTRGRRKSLSQFTDADLPMRRYFEQMEENVNEDPVPILLNISAKKPGEEEDGSDANSIKTPITDSTIAVSQSLSPTPSASILEIVRGGNSEKVAQLLNQGGQSLTERSPDGYTALHFCVIYDDVATAEVLLDRGANLNAKDNNLRSPFRLALESESLSVARLLVEKGAALGANVDDAVFDLAQHNVSDTAVFVAFLSALINRAGEGFLSKSQLSQRAVAAGNEGFIKILLEAGLDINSRDSTGVSLLIYAIAIKQISVIKLLVQRGANASEYFSPSDARSLDREVPWQKALWDESHEFGIRPLGLVSRHVIRRDLILLLVDHGADVNARSPVGGGVLLAGVCAFRYREATKALVERGANPNIKSIDSGQSAMYWEGVCGNLDMMELFVAHGGDVSVTAHDGCTPLHNAMHWERWSVAQLLIEHGADLYVKNRDGCSPLDLCKDDDKRRELVALHAEKVKQHSTGAV